jgi:hypothetical protein
LQVQSVCHDTLPWLISFSLDVVSTLPEHWSKFLLAQTETGMDYQVVAVTLRDGRVIEDVAIVHHSLVSQVRGYTDVPFDPVDITAIEVTHRKWDFQHESTGRNRAAI